MKLRICAVTGLIFLVINQFMLLQGVEFIQTQSPIDYAHWLLFIGVLLCLSINQIFSDNLFSNTATILTTIGVIALGGQAVIDFCWWSYGTDYDGMKNLDYLIMSNPSLRIPFMTIGPAFFYIGLVLHSLKFFKEQTIWTLITVTGVIVIGVSSLVIFDRMIISIGHIILTIGMSGLILLISNDDRTGINN